MPNSDVYHNFIGCLSQFDWTTPFLSQTVTLKATTNLAIKLNKHIHKFFLKLFKDIF